MPALPCSSFWWYWSSSACSRASSVRGSFANVDKSKETTAKAQIDVLSKAVDQLRLDIGRYPTTQEGLALLTTPPADGTRRLERSLPEEGRPG